MWQFWIDCGGTFTDVVAESPEGGIFVRKLLSHNPERYPDAAVEGIREILRLGRHEPIPVDRIGAIKIGTTIATNALLERRGERTVLAITSGFRDALKIAYQNRPDIFARRIVLPEALYERVVEIDERVSAEGGIVKPLNLAGAKAALREAFERGIRSCAIAFMHGSRWPEHEIQVADLAREIGFTQVSTSHETSALTKLVSRGDTTVVDAYLTPLLKRYVDQIGGGLDTSRLMFMQSNGGLTDAGHFQGKDSILSGPAGGIVGAVKTSERAGFNRIITFDMGGTSTDVAHYAGEFERDYETQVAGVRMRAPTLSIHTVAAGGGSVISFDGGRYRVGPRSAGANPGPSCYRRNGPLTVTDCNLMVGKLQADFFPKLFGKDGNQALDLETVQRQFEKLAGQIQAQTGDKRGPEQVAEGFLIVAVEKMADAIKKVSVQKGYDVSEYTLSCFGGAGGQHACLIANSLGIAQILIHPLSGVLSAYGVGLADASAMRERSVEKKLSAEIMPELDAAFQELESSGLKELNAQSLPGSKTRLTRKVHIRYEGTDSALPVEFAQPEQMADDFAGTYKKRYGFIARGRDLVVEHISLEINCITPPPTALAKPRTGSAKAQPVSVRPVFTSGNWHETPIFIRDHLQPGDRIDGPAIIVEATGTDMIEPGWRAHVSDAGDLILRHSPGDIRNAAPGAIENAGSRADPVRLEIFNNLFMSIAERMGYTLQNTSSSVNIKERLDFSCAIFDRQGQLVANAPHMPVHLGSMSESVQSLMAARAPEFRPGNVYAQNDPYNGGTHLPDITVITPVFDQAGREVIFYVASRGHHADIGGMTPGSMPPASKHIGQEGILIDNIPLVAGGHFLEEDLLGLLGSGAYPARNPGQNVADLKAQVAANEIGARELRKLVDRFGLDTVASYMRHVQDSAESSVRRSVKSLRAGRFSYPLDDGSRIEVEIKVDPAGGNALIDFSGTSAQLDDNFNAPAAICKAAVLYVFRTLIDGDLPLNYGCSKPLKINIPAGSMLNPRYPAAVVAGNVETSQVITDAIYAALGKLAACQGTMNNFTFGNDRYQYYETICGGAGAGPDFDGADAVHTHMTNSRLTDPEVLELRFPVLVESFSIREGSGGAGRYRGGNGVVRRIRFREKMSAAILSGRRAVPAFGIAGGGNGLPGRNLVERASGEIVELPACAQVEMGEGDVFVIETPGGGAFGPG